MTETEVRKMFADIDACHWDALPNYFHLQVVYERPGLEPIVGLGGLLRFYRQERAVVYGEHHIEQVVIQPGAGACWGHGEFVLRDGTTPSERFADVYLFTEGKISMRRSHFFRPAV